MSSLCTASDYNPTYRIIIYSINSSQPCKMAGTRSSARQAAQASSSPNSSQGKAASNSSAAGSKRKAEASASSKSKRGKKGNAKEQKTIEETMPDREDEDAVKDVEMKDATGSEKPAEEVVEKTENGASEDAQKGLKDREDAVAAREDAVKAKEAPKDEEGTSAANDKQNGEQRNKDASTMDETGKVEPEDGAQSEIEAATTTEEGAVQKSSERDESTPSSILEKGIIYFFFRGRVGIDEPSEVGDLARSYIVLRPLPHGAKLGEGAIGDAGNNRLLALPKKVLPKSPRDRFMIFVEKAKTSMDDIKDNHLTSSDYETKTAGARHTPAATPIAEGVYAITTTGRESHLAYILTIPSELSEVQEDIGLRERGSFITSVKNPQYSGPAGANLPQGPEYSKEYGSSRPSPTSTESKQRHFPIGKPLVTLNY